MRRATVQLEHCTVVHDQSNVSANADDARDLERAPVAERLRTVQSTSSGRRSTTMRPPLSTRCDGAGRARICRVIDAPPSRGVVRTRRRSR